MTEHEASGAGAAYARRATEERCVQRYNRGWNDRVRGSRSLLWESIHADAWSFEEREAYLSGWNAASEKLDSMLIG